jgi:PTH2 family peptidyl-tRNA hydrolase
MRQLIIARKDLQMSSGKLAAQVAHASMAFITERLSVDASWDTEVECTFTVPIEVWTDWFNDSITKTVCAAKTRNQLMRAITLAEEQGLREGRDFFLIHDACFTELEPEEVDEDGVGRTLTCIGFRPLEDEVAHSISKKFQLYK